nr:HTH-type transcriptional regulatory protein GabR [Paraburkholderia busanensis]
MPRGKTASSLDLPLPATFPLAGNRSKRDCIVDAIRHAISTGLLPAQGDLPSSRTLAERWQVSRGTVEAAFDQLHSEGYVTRTHGSGTRVSAIVPDSFLPPPSAGGARGPAEKTADAVQDARLPAASPDSPVRAGVPFVARLAAPELLQQSPWQKHSTEAAKGESAADAGSTPLRGLESLRQQIVAYLGAFRGLSCRPEDIFITSGIRYAIDAVARVVLTPGSKAAIEDPGYPGARRIVELAGASTIDVPVDEHGMRVAELEQHSDVSLVYITPAHQSPLGVSLSIDRRETLLDWAHAHRAWIIEDDYDGEFSFQSAPLPALKSQDRHQRVIYCSSFNKTVHAGLRVGFMVIPAALQPRVLALWQTIGSPVSATVQRALASFMASGDFASHLRRSRQAYQQRRDVVLRELDRHAREHITVTGSHAGFHFVLWLNWLKDGMDEQAIVTQAAAAGIELQPLASLCRNVSFGPAFIVGYSALSLAQARFFGRELGSILRAHADLAAC